MIDKFVKKFKEFAEHEDLESLTDEAKVALFGVYLDALRPTPAAQAPAVAQPSGSSNKRIRKPDRAATAKQKAFIRKLIAQRKLDDDTEVESLTVAQASSLIDQGIKAKARPLIEPEPEPEPEGEFTGSYSHASGGSSSAKAFWE